MNAYGRRWTVLLAAAFATVAATGCAVFEYSASKPINQVNAKSKKGTDVVAVGAERRLVYSQERGSLRETCAEPPPDVAQSFSDSLRVALEAAAKKETGTDTADASGKLSVARDFATAISRIYTRSQGVQLFRDGSFMLCQAYMNRALRPDKELEAELKAAINELNRKRADERQPQLKITAEALGTELNYTDQFQKLLEAAKTVLLHEVKHLYAADRRAAEEAAARAESAAVTGERHRGAAALSEQAADASRRAASESATRAEAAKAGAEKARDEAAKYADEAKKTGSN
jgi:hypothetical protein